MKAILLGLLAQIFFSTENPAAKQIYISYPNISPYEMLYIKSAVTLPISFLWSKSQGSHILDISHSFRHIVVLRGITSFFAIQGIWGSNKFMPLTTASCIYCTTPIWVSLIAYFYLNEKISRLEKISIFTSFLGVLIINDPFGIN